MDNRRRSKHFAFWYWLFVIGCILSALLAKIWPDSSIPFALLIGLGTASILFSETSWRVHIRYKDRDFLWIKRWWHVPFYRFWVERWCWWRIGHVYEEIYRTQHRNLADHEQYKVFQCGRCYKTIDTNEDHRWDGSGSA